MRGRTGVEARKTGWLPWLPPLLAGAAMRLTGLARQVPGGDEAHAVRAAVRESLPQLLSTFHESDRSLPLAALDRMVLLATGELGEAALRAPVVLAGLATPLLARLARRPLGEPTALVLAWLLALSPLLVYYGRIVRPYGIVAPLALLGAFAFLAWWRDGGWRPAAVFAGAAGLAVWLFPGTAPWFAGLLASGAVALVARRRWHRLPALAAVAVATAAAVLLPLLPAAPSFLEMMAAKGGARLPDATGWLAVATLHAGNDRAAMTFLVLLLAAAGAFALLRGERRLLFLLAVATVAQVGALVAFAPFAAASALVSSRYLIALQPALLLVVASGLVAVAGGLAPRWPRLARLLPVSVVLLWAATGPYASDPRLRFGPFAGSDEAVAFHRPTISLPAAAVPPVYGQLRGAGAVVEAVWRPSWNVALLPVALQRHHGRDVVLAVPLPDPLANPRIAFTNLVPASLEGILASRGRWLLVPRHPKRLTALVDDPLGRPATRLVEQIYPPHFWHLARQARHHWGPPDLADGDVRAWDLERVRRQLQAAPSPAAARPSSAAPRAAPAKRSTIAATGSTASMPPTLLPAWK